MPHQPREHCISHVQCIEHVIKWEECSCALFKIGTLFLEDKTANFIMYIGWKHYSLTKTEASKITWTENVLEK